MSIPDATPSPAALQLARDLLSGFNIQDDDTKEYLSSLLASGRVSREEENEVVSLSLMRGVEEWDMLIKRAVALEEKAPDPEWGLLGHLGALYGSSTTDQSADAGSQKQTRRVKQSPKISTRKSPPNRTVSHFWGDPNAGDETAPLDPHRRTTLLPIIPPAHFHTSVPRHPPPPPTATPTSHPAQPPTATTTSKNPTTSPFFAVPRPPPKVRPPRGTLSSLPIPPLSAPRFGLIQESLASDPFRLLVAVTFLIKTKAVVAIPYFHKLMEQFPGPEALAAADPKEIVEMIRPLGLSNLRCGVIQRLAGGWLSHPPDRGTRYGVKGYADAVAEVGVGVKYGERFGGEDEEGAEAVGAAWEVGHLVTGAYALDSWRIFCRDVLLGRAEGWNGEGSKEGFQPEWMRVVPADKELRACLRWMWMREGWWWDAETGEKEVLSEGIRRAVEEGRVGYDEMGRLVVLEGTPGGEEGGEGLE